MNRRYQSEYFFVRVIPQHNFPDVNVYCNWTQTTRYKQSLGYKFLKELVLNTVELNEEDLMVMVDCMYTDK